MNTFKKVYLIMILLTVFSFGTLALVSIGTISQYGETGLILYSLATGLLIGIIVMSRIANIFGNRQNLFVGYMGAICTLLYTILLIIEIILIATKNYDAVIDMSKVVSFFEKIEIVVIINVLIFEIPYVNDTHKKIQYVAAGLITLLAIVSFIQANDKKNNIYSSSYYSPTSIYDNNTEDTGKDLMTIVTYSCLALFFINPMLRVYWIDKDFYNSRDIYDVESGPPSQLTVNDMGKVHTNADYLNKPSKDPNLVPIVPVNDNNNTNNDYNKTEMVNKTNTIVEPKINEIIPEEEFTEPVVNKNYKPTDLSEVMIPSVDGNQINNNNNNN